MEGVGSDPSNTYVFSLHYTFSFRTTPYKAVRNFCSSFILSPLVMRLDDIFGN